MQDNGWSLGLKCARVFENNCRGSTAEVVTFRTVLCQPGAVEALRRPQAAHGPTESGRPDNRRTVHHWTILRLSGRPFAPVVYTTLPFHHLPALPFIGSNGLLSVPCSVSDPIPIPILNGFRTDSDFDSTVVPIVPFARSESFAL
ncbi:hypothetical protein CROQUDRAFT_96532 [Cronartium quercuum f. sp. fusiforme G11]|uniref:Uncharacterized protein n=1 Tax=Cronartium quercuum f. sp. fusiforme G11 TaxID=708437 RepID=A0A9P6NGN4_9BASI|nr:hypothetical protein CROQUDRAFT_96532 [Cronartium quercuum f. sp. fusiforme G11]